MKRATCCASLPDAAMALGFVSAYTKIAGSGAEGLWTRRQRHRDKDRDPRSAMLATTIPNTFRVPGVRITQSTGCATLSASSNAVSLNGLNRHSAAAAGDGRSYRGANARHS